MVDDTAATVSNRDTREMFDRAEQSGAPCWVTTCCTRVQTAGHAEKPARCSHLAM